MAGYDQIIVLRAFRLKTAKFAMTWWAMKESSSMP
jgi:hypothetical protein